MANGPYYEIIKDYGVDRDSITTSCYWVVVVVRLGLPLSYSRRDGRSVSTDVSEGAKLRGPNLIITSDSYELTVGGDKGSHLESLTTQLRQTDHNYLVEVLPGDWVLAWIADDLTRFEDLLSRIRKGEACNKWNDGLKFVGRASSIRKRISLNKASGAKTSAVTLSATGFEELDSQLFFDNYLSSNDTTQGGIGSWLFKLGLDLEKLFTVDETGQKNNSRALIAALIDLIVGKGVQSGRLNQAERFNQQNGTQGAGSVQQAAGAGSVAEGEAPYAYLVPRAVGQLLGVSQASKEGGILAYSDILSTLMGVQNYASTRESHDDPATFFPDVERSDTNRMFTGKELLGTFIPVMPEVTCKPLWSVLQQFLNPVVNEMYTALKADHAGRVYPTLVVRQIPFTTEVFDPAVDQPESGTAGPAGPAIEVTRFLNLPRWLIHPTMVQELDVGRSNATRFNFVHVYGQEANLVEQVSITQQLVTNPPIRDDLDIQRSGLRPYMTTVACAPKDQIGSTPKKWMQLAADHLMGSQYTLNGQIVTAGIVAPICKGDNIEFDGVVYHIEAVSHHAVRDASGVGSFITSLSLSNGMRAAGKQDVTTRAFKGTGAEPETATSAATTTGNQPIYPGFKPEDNTAYDPGQSVDDRFERTAPDVANGDLDADHRSTDDSAPDTTESAGPTSRQTFPER